jgi:hypothetical protein
MHIVLRLRRDGGEGMGKATAVVRVPSGAAIPNPVALSVRSGQFETSMFAPLSNTAPKRSLFAIAVLRNIALRKVE